ncbi:hypothetical protein GCM10023321_50760 [Pseudonocardia eucalypti]|uniref:DUF1508 domain-containing protein n=1 Tax=Pseudonocardia eucalypti TaxID=648755 RepID=A0ABP9QKS6_9PSEU|nr:hypothetical protein [Pseudonocardia eucalypti]
MALAASGRACIEDVSFERMAVLGPEGAWTAQVFEDRGRFEVFGRAVDGEQWVRCAHGRARTMPEATGPGDTLDALRRRCSTEVAGG